MRNAARRIALNAYSSFGSSAAYLMYAAKRIHPEFAGEWRITI